LEFNDDKNIIDILIAKTTKTGANISLIIFENSKCHINHSDFQPTVMTSSKTFNKTSIGDAAITNQRIHILDIKTTAKATKGKNKITAKKSLTTKFIKSATTPSLPLGSSAKLEKSNNEEYIVIKGQTNHLDLSNRLSIVYFIDFPSFASTKNLSFFFSIPYHLFTQPVLNSEKLVGIILHSSNNQLNEVVDQELK